MSDESMERLAVDDDSGGNDSLCSAQPSGSVLT